MAEEGYYLKGQNALLDGIAWEVGKQTKELNGRQVYIEISQLEPERLKRFDESRSSFTRVIPEFYECMCSYARTI